MSELAYQFCSEIDGYKTGDIVRRFEFWLRVRRVPADVMQAEVASFQKMLDMLTETAP